MEVLSVSEAWAVAKEIVGSAEIIGSSTSYYGNVAQLMQANGWTAVTKGSEVLYYTRPAQVAIESGVKAYTEVATVSDVAVAESGAVTSATATTTGIGVTVAKSAIAGAAAACFGYNVGTKIYDSNPEFWDGLLNEVNEWTVENVPEGGVNAIVSVLNGVDTVLTLPESLLNKIKTYSINAGAYTTNIDIKYNGVNVDSNNRALVTVAPFSSAYVVKAIESAIAHSTDSTDIAALNVLLHNVSNIMSYVNNKLSSESTNYNAAIIKAEHAAGGVRDYAKVDIIFSNIESDKIYTLSHDNYRDAYYLGKDGTFRVFSFGVNYYNPGGGMVKLQDTSRYSIEDYYFYPTVVSSDGILTYYNLNCSSNEQKGIPGTSVQDAAKYPSLDKPISDTYPDWWNKRTTVDNGEGGSTNWLPVSITDKIVDELGDDQTQEQAQSGTDTNTDSNTNIKVTDDSGSDDKTTNPDSTDTGDTPVVLPSTSIFGIAGVYNPTLEQIKSFTGWLWSENPITQLQQMFSNPMNAIIGLHLIYVTPSTSAEKSIGVGYLDSGILSKVVSEQYVTIDCGSVTIPSYYNNVNDWSPYTKISCYLPFIGIVKLNTDDLMSSDGNLSQLNITYKVDVLTGACLAMLKVKRGSSNAILYQYNGSCSVQLPLTSGNYGGIIASLITTAVGVVSGFTPLAIGGAMSLTHPKADIQRSGQLGANVGAMGIKKPYLIIERPYSKYAGSYAKHIGYPSNNTIKLSACSGYTRVKSTDVNNINTTEEERKMILDLLTSGIYI